MKSELIHLLSKLKTDHPDFQNLIITTNGAAMACLRHGYLRFESLDALEAYAWPQQENVQSPMINAQSSINPSNPSLPSRSSRPSVQPEIPTPPQ